MILPCVFGGNAEALMSESGDVAVFWLCLVIYIEELERRVRSWFLLEHFRLRSCPELKVLTLSDSMEAKKGFSLNATAAKRVGEQMVGANRKIPKVSGMVRVRYMQRKIRLFFALYLCLDYCTLFDRMTSVPTRQQSTSRSQVNAPVNLCVYKITSASGDCWPQYPDTQLWQVQWDHDTRPSGNWN